MPQGKLKPAAASGSDPAIEDYDNSSNDGGHQRWTARRRSELVLCLLRGETTPQEAARKHGLTVAEIEDWRNKALAGQENALRSKPRDEQGLVEAEIKRLKQKIGELVMDNDILKEAAKLASPLGSAASRE